MRVFILCVGFCLHYVAGAVFGLGVEQANAQSNRFANYTDTTNNLNIEMIAVQGGTFMMGCTVEQGNNCLPDEKPVHQVTVSDFYIGKFELTQSQWYNVMGNYPKYNHNLGFDMPVEFAEWDETQEFICKLNALTGKQYHLSASSTKAQLRLLSNFNTFTLHRYLAIFLVESNAVFEYPRIPFAFQIVDIRFFFNLFEPFLG